MFFNQNILPAIPNHQTLNKFLESKYQYGILMNFQLAQLPDLIQKCHDANKKILIHSELIKGLSHDAFGAIFLIQYLHVDGIISSKAKVIEVCKKRHVIGIYRFFLKDSISLEQSIDIARKLEPIYIEVLPASFEMIGVISKQLSAHILMGGLIQNKNHVEQCLTSGAIAVTTSNVSLW